MLPLKQAKCHLSAVLSLSRRQWFLAHFELRVLWDSETGKHQYLLLVLALRRTIHVCLAPCSTDP